MTADRSSIPFALVDVFADEPLSGNPLALVPDADDLTEDRMRRIAREFNQSETTFLVRPTREGADVRLRSFTAAEVEVLGAGHNAMGAWLWLAETERLRHRASGLWAQEIGPDVLPVQIGHDGARHLVTMRQSAPRFGRQPGSLDRLAGALGLQQVDLEPGLPTRVVGTGADHLLVAVTGPTVVDAADVDGAALRLVLAQVGAEGCYVYATAETHDIDAYARFFNPTAGIVEDPATGTAAGPLAAALARHRQTDGTAITILQGRLMGRPSRLHVRVEGDDVRLSGSGLVVADGVLRL